VAIVAAAATGCARRQVFVPRHQVPRRAVVLDFAEADKVRTLPKEVVGWWFGGRDVLRDENIGQTIADEVHATLGELSYLDLYSRLDLKYYNKARKEKLRSTFKDPAYTEVEYDKMMDRISPLAIGRDLMVDYVVAGRVNDAYLARNRTIEWTWSRVDVDIELWDVRTGKVIWRLKVDDSRQLASPALLMRELLWRHLDAIDAALQNAQSARADGRAPITVESVEAAERAEERR
jgi:hypothetical protein